jgi:hypothetical protein
MPTGVRPDQEFSELAIEVCWAAELAAGQNDRSK